MAKDREIGIIVDAKNKAKSTFMEVSKDLRNLGDESTRSLGIFNKSIDMSLDSVKNFTDKFSFMDKVVKRGLQGTAASASLYTAATLRDFSQLNDGISQVNTLYEQTGKSQKQMYKDSIEMFRMIPTDFDKITSGIYNTISAGANPEDATMYARKFGMAGVAGDADMDIVTTAAMGTMNAYKLEAEDLTKVLDLQFMTVKEGIVSYSELASSLGTGVLASAKGAGVSLEELQGSIALITKNAIPANIATTSLNQLFNKFTDTKVIKEFKDYGVAIQDANKNTRPLLDIFKDLNYQFDKRGLSSEQRKGFLKELVGSESAARGIESILGNLEEFQRILEQMENPNGAMRSAYDDRLESMQTQIKMFWNNLKASGVEQIFTLDPFVSKLLEPTIEKQKLKIDIEELRDAYKLEKDPVHQEALLDIIASLEMDLDSFDPVPVEELRDALAESVNELEKLNPPLAKFLDTVGNFALNFVGEEGQDNRNTAKNIGKGVAGVYAFKKTIDALSWINDKAQIFKKSDKGTDKTGSASDLLGKNLKSMNVNAAVVNVFGKGKGNLPKPPSIPGKPKLPGGKPIELPVGTGLKDVTHSVVEAAAAKAAKEAVLAGLPAIGLGVLALGKEKKDNDRAKALQSNAKNLTYDYKNKKYVTKDDMDKYNKQIKEMAFKNPQTISSGKKNKNLSKEVLEVTNFHKTIVEPIIYKSPKIEKNKDNVVKIDFVKDGITSELKLWNKRYNIKEDNSPILRNHPKDNIKTSQKSIEKIDTISPKIDLMRDNVLSELKTLNNKKEIIDNKVDLQNRVSVDAPKVSTNVYIDGKNIPVQRIEVNSTNSNKYENRQIRRYGRQF